MQLHAILMFPQPRRDIFNYRQEINKGVMTLLPKYPYRKGQHIGNRYVPAVTWLQEGNKVLCRETAMYILTLQTCVSQSFHVVTRYNISISHGSQNEFSIIKLSAMYVCTHIFMYVRVCMQMRICVVQMNKSVYIYVYVPTSMYEYM